MGGEPVPPVSIMIKPASGLCNMHCAYCFYRDEQINRERENYGMMTEKTLKNVIRRSLVPAEGQYSIAFQGGEPTLSGIPFFEKAVAYVKQYNLKNIRVSFALQTNGYCIDEDWCRFFHDNQFLIGLSLDGAKEIHDRYRHGNDSGGSYDRVMQAVSLFNRFGVEYNILTVVHRETAENIETIYRDYRAKGFYYLQFIPCLDPFGEQRGSRPWSLTPEVYGDFLIRLFDLWYEDFFRNTQPYIRQFENYLGILLGYLPEACDQRGFCGNQLVAEADGSVYPCDFYALDEYCLGNLNEDRLPVIDARRKAIHFTERSLVLPDVCKSCEYIRVCRGGCYRCRLGSGEEGIPGMNYYCPAYKRFFHHSLEKMLKIADQIRKNGTYRH